MAGKKGGENTKKASGNAQKAEAAAKRAADEQAKKNEAEADEWSKGAKGSAKKSVPYALPCDPAVTPRRWFTNMHYFSSTGKPKPPRKQNRRRRRPNETQPWPKKRRTSPPAPRRTRRRFPRRPHEALSTCPSWTSRCLH